MPTLRDIADIVFLTFVAYQLYVWFKETRALRVLIGLALLGGVYSLAKLWGLFLTTYVFQIFWQVLLILLLILFQSEIKQVLEKVSPLRYLKARKNALKGAFADDLARTVFELAQETTGALIVLAGDHNPSEFIQSGHTIMAFPEPALIKSIFNKHSPVHDGAILIYQDRIVKMGGILPLSEQEDIPSKYGTRHRAAIGLSELTDAVCIVVSEERAEVSTIKKGKIETWGHAPELAQRLKEWLGIPVYMTPVLKEMVKLGMVRNWQTKLGVLALVSAAWLIFAGQQEISLSVSAEVKHINLPVGMKLEEATVDRVQLKLSGKRGKIMDLKDQEVPVYIDLGGMGPGRHWIRFTAKNVDLPIGVKIDRVIPPEIQFVINQTEQTGRVP